jgi:HK97 family phage major capsid protein
MLKAIAAEGREPTASEYTEIEGLLDEAQAAWGVEKKLKSIGQALGAPGGISAGEAAAFSLSPGERFVQSPGYKDLFGAGAARGDSWTTGLIEVGPPRGMEMKGTLGEGGLPATGGQPFVSVPQLVPGAVTTLFQPMTIESLLSSGVADSPTVRFLTEGTATNAATGVAEGGTKPESTLGLTSTDEPVRKIATLLPVSEELLEDGPAIQAYINQRLSLFVNLSAEQQIFRGAAGGPGVQGILTSRNVPIYTGGTADDKAKQLFLAANSMRGSAFVEPEWFVVHPTDWAIVRLLRDTAGQYFGGGPFMGAYGNATMAGASGLAGGPQDSLWGKPVYVTASVGGAGTALVGTSQNACVWNRGGLRVEASNSHQNYFALNLVAVRAERRFALAVYRPTGFVEARLAVGPGG